MCLGADHIGKKGNYYMRGNKLRWHTNLPYALVQYFGQLA